MIYDVVCISRISHIQHIMMYTLSSYIKAEIATMGDAAAPSAWRPTGFSLLGKRKVHVMLYD